jgi:hypothetical protein
MWSLTIGRLVVDQVEALVDGVGRAGEPPRAQPLLGGHRRDVVAEQGRHAPRLGDVPVERMGFVLGQDDHLEITAVGKIRQHEVDHAVDAAERDAGLCPVRRQGHQALTLTTGQNDRKHLDSHGRTLTFRQPERQPKKGTRRGHRGDGQGN